MHQRPCCEIYTWKLEHKMYQNQGEVVAKPVNVNPGLKVTEAFYFFLV